MNKFSNESKKRYEKEKAIVKTIVKRYSIFVWLPILLYVFYTVGISTLMLISKEGMNREFIKNFYGVFVSTFFGFIVVLGIIVLIVLLGECCKDFFEYLKRKTIIRDFREAISLICEAIVDGICFLVKIPKKIYDRIKSEPERFKNALNKEITKQK